MDWVTIFRGFNPAEAQLVRSRLEAAQFHAQVADELSALSIDGYAMAAGGIRVQVPADEVDAAKEFLARAADLDPESEAGSDESKAE